MTISNRLMALGLVGSASITVLLATQVSAVVPPEEVRRAEAALPVCSPTTIELARDRAASHMRMLAIFSADASPATDYLSALDLIESRKHLAAYKAHLAEERDTSLRTMAMCGQPTAIDRCTGYKPDTADQLARRGRYEDNDAWQHRVGRARAEAALCGATLPEAVDPGTDCSDDNVHRMRVQLAELQRRGLVYRSMNLATGEHEAEANERFMSYLRLDLAHCGHREPVNHCYGTTHEQLLQEADFWERQANADNDQPRMRKMAALEAALCRGAK